MAVAAQMFGSGKTTLGRNFTKQLNDEETKAFMLQKLTGRLEARIDASTKRRIMVLQLDRLQNYA